MSSVKLSMLALVMSIVIFPACGDSYRKSYSGEPELSKALKGRPTLIIAQSYNDIDRVICDGYDSIGTSGFWSEKDEPFEDAVEQGRRVGAEVVVVLKKYAGQRNASWVQSIYSPGTVTTTTTAGNYGENNQNSFSATSYTQNPSTTTYIPRSETLYRYDYLAVYLRKLDLSKFKLGVMLKDGVPDDIKKAIGANAGVLVRFVYKNTVAYRSDIMIGDVIISVNENKVYESKAVTEAIAIAADRINFTIWRDGKEILKAISLK